MLLLPGRRWRRPSGSVTITIRGIDYNTNRVTYHFSDWGSSEPVTIESQQLIDFIRNNAYERIEDATTG